MNCFPQAAETAMFGFIVFNAGFWHATFATRSVGGPDDFSLTLRTFVANFVIVPPAADVLTKVFPLGTGFTVGLLLLATSGGNPRVTKLTNCHG
jgi:predicted Na+-dependent transporter